MTLIRRQQIAWYFSSVLDIDVILVLPTHRMYDTVVMMTSPAGKIFPRY